MSLNELQSSFGEHVASHPFVFFSYVASGNSNESAHTLEAAVRDLVLEGVREGVMRTGCQCGPFHSIPEMMRSMQFAGLYDQRMV